MAILGNFEDLVGYIALLFPAGSVACWVKWSILGRRLLWDRRQMGPSSGLTQQLTQ